MPQSPRLLLVGLNHKTAPLALRERLAFNEAQTRAALEQLKSRFQNVEAVLVSTCNRVEVYMARPANGPGPADIGAYLADFHRLPFADVMGHLYHHEETAVAQHLFSVASSLDSMVIGETQILSQVKAAYAIACDVQSVGPVTHGLFQRALAAAKAVHEETRLSAGRVSIASVAVDLARSVFDRFADKTVLCIGAGKMADLLLTHLVALGPKKIKVTNRSPERALELSAKHQGTGAPFDCLPQLITDADIIVTSTGATDPIITTAMFKGLLKARRYRPALIIDIAVPRDVEAGVGELNNVYLYNIDDLQGVAAGNRQKRDDAIADGRNVVERHVADFVQWFAARDVGPLVKALYDQANATAEAELAVLLSKHPELTENQREDLQRLTHRLVGKLLHTPVKQVTESADTNSRPTLAAALRKLFGL